MEPHQLGWKPLKDSYMDTLPSSLTEEHKELVRPSGPFPFCPSLSPDSSSQRPSRIVFTFIIMEGKEGQEIPWLSPITLLSGFLPLLFYLFCMWSWNCVVNFCFLFHLLHYFLTPQWRILALEKCSIWLLGCHPLTLCPPAEMPLEVDLEVYQVMKICVLLFPATSHPL